MPTYEVKSRTTGPITVSSVQAETSQDAIHATLAAAGEGESVEVMSVIETAPDVANPQARKEK